MYRLWCCSISGVLHGIGLLSYVMRGNCSNIARKGAGNVNHDLLASGSFDLLFDGGIDAVMSEHSDSHRRQSCSCCDLINDNPSRSSCRFKNLKIEAVNARIFKLFKSSTSFDQPSLDSFEKWRSIWQLNNELGILPVVSSTMFNSTHVKIADPSVWKGCMRKHHSSSNLRASLHLDVFVKDLLWSRREFDTTVLWVLNLSTRIEPKLTRKLLTKLDTFSRHSGWTEIRLDEMNRDEWLGLFVNWLFTKIPSMTV